MSLNHNDTSQAESRQYQIKSVATSITGYMVEGFDLLVIGFLLAAISTSLSVSPTSAAALVTWTLIGTVVGGIFFGVLSDRFGRVKALKWGIGLYIIATTLCFFSFGYYDLLIYRFFVGFALGGEYGIGMTLVAESWPSSKRGRVASYVGLGWQSGVLMAAILPAILMPFIGWKGLFLVGVLPAAIAFMLRSRLPEPKIFTQKRDHKKQKVPIKLLFCDARTIKSSLGIIILTSVQNLGYYGLMIWLPTYMAKQFNFSLTKSSLWTAATIIGMGVGIWLFGRMADKLGRKPTFLIYQVGAFVMVLLYSQLSSPELLLIAGAFMGLFVNGMLAGYGVLISESYPTEIRGTAQNVLFNIGRGIGALGPILVGYLAQQFSFSLAIAFLASIYILDIIATLFLIKESKNNILS
ncbi:benzoate transport [Orbus hercynius]|uniref:Benzoate transport n=1 Tax=Orbus hercynius TaxID=593135 RepID=A0A495RCU7_9GAMM|nr:MFS transporter [Orbus hercynius]RKS85171.1 benzoate transport [Orbus hercynius]